MDLKLFLIISFDGQSESSFIFCISRLGRGFIKTSGESSERTCEYVRDVIDRFIIINRSLNRIQYFSYVAKRCAYIDDPETYVYIIF